MQEFIYFIYKARESCRNYLCQQKLETWKGSIFKVFQKTEDPRLFTNDTIYVNPDTKQQTLISKALLLVVKRMNTRQVEEKISSFVGSLQEENINLVSRSFIYRGKILSLVFKKTQLPI